MQGINRNWLPGEAIERKKIIPSVPATQTNAARPISEAMVKEVLQREKEKYETDILYKELTGKDPDLTQFNYGRCKPWNDYMKANGKAPAEYLRTQSLEDAVGKRAMQLSHAAWELSMACKSVRDADNQPEFEAALARLKLARVKYDLLGIDGTYNQANMPGEPTDYVWGENI